MCKFEVFINYRDSQENLEHLLFTVVKDCQFFQETMYVPTYPPEILEKPMQTLSNGIMFLGFTGSEFRVAHYRCSSYRPSQSQFALPVYLPATSYLSFEKLYLLGVTNPQKYRKVSRNNNDFGSAIKSPCDS
jgi:hypothetical protein